MLHQLQVKYAEQPVRFLLIPCNQFGAQEPAANKDVKAFAQKSVTLARAGMVSNVIMLAKSNLNGVRCTYEGEEACTSTSAACCPKNDAVYQYLLSVTSPGRIKWNFDKIIIGKDGKPFKDEVILHGDALEQQLSMSIDKLVAGTGGEAEDVVLSSRQFSAGPWPVIAAMAVAGLVFAWSSGAKLSGTYQSESKETSNHYILVE